MHNKKYIFIFFITIALIILPPFIRAFLQINAKPENPYILQGINREFSILWKGEKFYLDAVKEIKPESCFLKDKKCFCLRTIPSFYKTIFKRPLSWLKGKRWIIGRDGKNILVKVSKTSLNKFNCSKTIIELRREKDGISFRACTDVTFEKWCRKERIPPGEEKILRPGEKIIIEPIGMKISLSREVTILPGRKKGIITLFPSEQIFLNVMERFNKKPYISSLHTRKNSYKLKEGRTKFIPSPRAFPLLPPASYYSQREVFLEKIINSGCYQIKNGLYYPLPKGKTAKIGRKLGYWDFYIKQLTALNEKIGEKGIYSRLPCFKMNLKIEEPTKKITENDITWFYRSFTYPGWKTETGTSRWKNTFKMEGWICGERWEPYFNGTRKRYFKGIINLTSKPILAEVRIPENGFLFVNGKIAGEDNFKELLHRGKNVIGLMLEIEGIKNTGILRIDRALNLYVKHSEKRLISFHNRRGGKIYAKPGSLSSNVNLLKNNTEILIPRRAIFVFPANKYLKLKIDKNVYHLKVETPYIENKDFIYERSESKTLLGDILVFWEDYKGVLSLKKNKKIKILNKNAYSLYVKDGKLLISGVGTINPDEIFSINKIKFSFHYTENSMLMYPCLSLKGWEKCYTFKEGSISTILNPILSNMSLRHILENSNAKLYLTLDADLQKIATSELESSIQDIKKREDEKSADLQKEVSSLAHHLSLLRKEYFKKRTSASAKKILGLEKKLNELKLKLNKIKNPFYEGAVILLDQDGKILAAASYPYLPMDEAKLKEAIKSGKDASLINRCWSENCNPGSTFKLVDAIAFLETRDNRFIERLLEKFPFYGKGSENLKGKRLLNGKEITFDLRNFKQEVIREQNSRLETALAHSYNVYFAYLAMHLYEPSIYRESFSIFPFSYFKSQFPLLKFSERLGFNSRFNLSATEKFPVLSAKSISPVNAYTINEIAHYSIGQAGVRATPLQLALVSLSIYRKGTLPNPSLIEKIIVVNKEISRRHENRRIFSTKTAEKIEHAMNLAVTSGTASSVFKNWEFRTKLFAKTGTAETTLYKDNAWFVGYFKVNPEKAIIFAGIIPRAGIGGRIAAPLIKRILDKYLKLQRLRSNPE